MNIQRWTGSEPKQGINVLLLQPQQSWRQKISAQYRPECCKSVYAGILKTVSHEWLEQIDLLWLFMLKYSKVKIYDPTPEMVLMMNCDISEKIKSALRGDINKGIPRLLTNQNIEKITIEKNAPLDAAIQKTSLDTKIPAGKIKQNYALKFPVLKDLEILVPDFNKIYNSI